MIPFFIIATVVTVLVLIHVTRPLWRGRAARRDDQIPLAVYREHRQRLERDVAEGRLDEDEARQLSEQLDQELLEQIADADPTPEPGRHRGAAAAIGVLVVATSVLVYLQLGRPDSLLPQVSDTATANPQAAPALEQAVEGLATRLRENPDNPDDWLLLGRSYAAMDRWSEARQALERARELAPDRAEILVDYAEALARVAGARLAGEPLTLLQRALRLDPGNQKGIWLLGMGFYQAGEFSRAADTWERLLATMPAGEPARAALEQQIADARSAAGAPAAAPAPTGEPPAVPEPGDTRVSVDVEVDLEPELAARLTGRETLFVFARAPEGPPMPLAVRRMPIPEFPVRVTLDESMAMMPEMSLANFEDVIIGARISRTGTAQAQPGDLETLSAPVAVQREEPVRLTIGQVVE